MQQLLFACVLVAVAIAAAQEPVYRQQDVCQAMAQAVRAYDAAKGSHVEPTMDKLVAMLRIHEDASAAARNASDRIIDLSSEDDVNTRFTIALVVVLVALVVFAIVLMSA